MRFEKTSSLRKKGEKVGYVISLFLFSAVLYLVLSFSGKLPQSWGYAHIFLVSVVIGLVGFGLERLLR